MTYKVSSTERLRSSSAEHETKSLLYLINLRKDSDEVFFCVIDFFNDLTGLDKLTQKSWDVQSKGATNTPAKVGQSLVTLFKNYLSDLNFNYYILFMGGVTGAVRIDDTKEEFDYTNIKVEALSKIKQELDNEAKSKSYMQQFCITYQNIDDFIKRVIFVVDNKTKAEYIKSVIKVNSAILPNDIFLNKIFNEIKKEQSAKKEGEPVENLIINTFGESLYYYRHLKSDEIKMLVLNRIINYYMIRGNQCTISFYPILNRIPLEHREEFLENCKLQVQELQFNVNNGQNIWQLFSHIYVLVEKNLDKDVEFIYTKIDLDIASKVNLDSISLKYFIAIIKDGVKRDN